MNSRPSTEGLLAEGSESGAQLKSSVQIIGKLEPAAIHSPRGGPIDQLAGQSTSWRANRRAGGADRPTGGHRLWRASPSVASNLMSTRCGLSAGLTLELLDRFPIKPVLADPTDAEIASPDPSNKKQLLVPVSRLATDHSIAIGTLEGRFAVV